MENVGSATRRHETSWEGDLLVGSPYYSQSHLGFRVQGSGDDLGGTDANGRMKGLMSAR